MVFRLVFPLLVVSFAVLSTSCEDPELVEKKNQQERRIASLRNERDLLKEKLDPDFDRNHGANHEKVVAAIAKTKRAVTTREEGLERLEEAKSEAEEGFAQFKRDFPTNL